MFQRHYLILLGYQILYRLSNTGFCNAFTILWWTEKYGPSCLPWHRRVQNNFCTRSIPSLIAPGGAMWHKDIFFARNSNIFIIRWTGFCLNVHIGKECWASVAYATWWAGHFPRSTSKLRMETFQPKQDSNTNTAQNKRQRQKRSGNPTGKHIPCTAYCGHTGAKRKHATWIWYMYGHGVSLQWITVNMLRMTQPPVITAYICPKNCVITNNTLPYLLNNGPNIHGFVSTSEGLILKLMENILTCWIFFSS